MHLSLPLTEKERRALWTRQWNARNKEKVAENTKRYQERYPERASACSKRTKQNNPIQTMFTDARIRAERSGMEFTITKDDIFIPMICPLLGIPLLVDHVSRYVKGKPVNDNKPSLDRIDSSKGYIPGNVWVISWRANNLKKDATFEELVILGENAKKYVDNHPINTVPQGD